jgi:voltage-gated potassium channel Kch
VATAVGLGVAGVARVGAVLVPFIVIGPLLVVAYNAELFGGLVHTDIGFALAWGSFPVLVGYVAQDGGLGLTAALAAAAACALSLAQRTLSTPARTLRRRVSGVEGILTFTDGTSQPIDETMLRAPLEGALRAMSWGLVALAGALAVARLP